MQPTYQMNVLRVFLASPSDLAEERKMTKEIVNRLNPTIHEIGWTVQLLGWEDRVPGYGRPQAQINEHVDVCDLFLGLLWRRWGSPSGKYSSGFEEEFKRAVNRRQQSESPEILIYFKRVDNASDPGEQLRQVLAFREEVERERELLFGQFDTASEWAITCHDALFRYVFKRVSPGLPKIQATASTTSPSRPKGFIQALQSGAYPLLPEQLRRVSIAIGDAARQQGAAQFNEKLLNFEDYDLVRLHLLGASLLYEKVSQDIPSVHAANLFYKYRKQLDTLTVVEKRLAVASMLSEGNSYVPGWYWVRDLSGKKVVQWLESIAMKHPDEEVRTSTLNLLTSRPALTGMTRTNELVSGSLGQSSDEMCTAVLDYAARYGDSTTADIIDARISDMPEALEPKARVTIGRIRTRQAPNLVIDRLIETNSEPVAGLLTFIGEAIVALDDAKLRRILAHKSTDLRVMAAERLACKEVLTAEEAKALLSDSETKVRAIGIRRLIVLGEPPTAGNIREILADDRKEKPKTLGAFLRAMQDVIRPDDLVEELFSTFSYDELIKLVKWVQVDGCVAYKVLGLMHFERFGDRIRTDLADQFATFREKAKHSLRESYREILRSVDDKHRSFATTLIARVEHAADVAVADLERLDDSITSGFVSAALAALAKNGSARDLLIARQYLNSKDSASREAALEIVSRFGDISDVEHLLALASREQGDIAKRAAETALDLSADRWIGAKKYLDREATPFLRVGIDALGKHTEFASRWPELVPYLFVGNDSVRLETAKLLCSCLKKVDLLKLLNQYCDEETYYYDVITVLDRSIYGPTAWRTI